MQSQMSLHCPVISFEFLCYHSIDCINVSKHLYGHGDYESMTHELLNIDWAHLFEGQDTNAIWLCFHTKLLNQIDKYIPIENFNSKSKPKWLDLFTLKKIKFKHKIWNIYKTTRNHEDFIYYAECRTLLLQLLNMPNCHLKPG